MPKTNAPSEVTIAGRTIQTNALPDPFDELDLVYRPRLQVLPHQLDQRAGQAVLDQTGQSCTGHAVAALINTVLSVPKRRVPEHGSPRKAMTSVSPYMLYALARRYDEFPGDADVGSSLRAAFKGWYYHGVCSDDRWRPETKAEEVDLDDEVFIAECRRTPLGAYYRVNARRVDDMQSAITELNAIAVSAAIHEGWLAPRRRGRGAAAMTVIEPSDNPVGGHAFLVAGYNDVGFLVQNSWGTEWGRHGYATLPYDDWFKNGYDAWVARPGVPQLGVAPRRRVVVAPGTTLTVGTGPDPARLKSYVINVTAGGRPSDKGKIRSTPEQIRGIVDAMRVQHDTWIAAAPPGSPAPRRRLVLYAHGGLVGEAGGIAIADRMINWWSRNQVYPVHIVWESDAITTIFSFLDHIKEALPFGGILDGFWEALDAKLERAGRNIQQLWREMKENAREASGPLKGGSPLDDPGVTLFIDRLKAYHEQHPDLEVHLVGHSAGSVLLASVVERLVAQKIRVESLQLMGAAIRVDEFVDKVIPHLSSAPGSSGMVRRFTAYDLRDKAEADDVCPGPPVPAIYHKSLLYFVARSLEPAPDRFEQPMIGLETAMRSSYTMPDGVSRPLLDVIGGARNLVVAPDSAGDADSRSRAKGHGEFDDDPDTMTSVLLRILNRRSLANVTPYPRGGMPAG
ncbi:MAG TPA: C1 family peptidase [Candidatus Limnocylindrales bacterium]